MNKLLIFLLSLCVTSLQGATITNWGAQLPTMVPASGDAILMQKGGVTYYFTPVQLATFISTNLSLGTSNAILNLNGRGTNATFAATIGVATNLWQLLGTNGLPLVFVNSNQVMTVSNTLIVSARPQSTTTVPLTIAGSQGQDANLFNVKDYLGNVLFAISYDGTFTDPRLASPSSPGALWTATDDIGNGAWSTNLTPQNLSISNVIALKALVLNANKQVTNAATSSADLDNFFAMGITSIVASTGIEIGTNGGKLVITNTGATTVSNAVIANLNGKGTNTTFYGIVTGATVRATNLYDSSNVKFWGAVGDGVTDDTIAIQEAVNNTPTNSVPYGSLVSGGQVTFPAGIYKITNAIRLHEGVSIVGAGREIVTIKNRGTTNDVFFFSADDRPYYSRGVTKIQGLNIYSSNATAGAAIHLVSVTNSAQIIVHDVEIFGGYDGITIESSTQAHISDCFVQGMTNNGISLLNLASSDVISGCYVTECGTNAIYLRAPIYCSLVGNVVESSKVGIYITGGLGNTIVGNASEECSDAFLFASNSVALTVVGGDSYFTAACSNAFQIYGGSTIIQGHHVRSSVVGTPTGYPLWTSNPLSVDCIGVNFEAFSGRIVNNRTNLTWVGNATTNMPPLFIGTKGLTNVLVFNTNGFFGIGNSNPRSILNLAGSGLQTVTLERTDAVAASGSLSFVGSDALLDWEVAVNKEVGGAGFEINQGSGATTRFLIKADGSVGMGTVSPSSSLDVTGQVRSVSAIFTNSVTVVGTTNQLIFGNTNPAPASAVAPTKWISVQITGDATLYRLPLYQ